MAVVDPFKGLIDGVLQGHAIATQLRSQAMQEEQFQRMKARDDSENQMRDFEMQQQLLGHGARQVTNGMVEEPGPVISSPLGVPGPGNSMPASQTQMPTVMRKAGGDGRFVATLKNSQGQTNQYEMPSAEEQLQRQLHTLRATGMATAQNAAMTDVYKRQAEQGYQESEEARRGVVVPPVVVQAGLRPAGARVLDTDLAGLIKQAQDILSPVLKDVGPGTSLISIPKPGSVPAAQSAPAADSTPDSQFADLAAVNQASATPNPLMQAAMAGQQQRSAFVTQAKTAGGQPPAAAPGSPTVLMQNPDKATGDFEKVYLPAYAKKLGKTPATLSPDETMAAVNEYAKRSKDETGLALAHQLAMLRLSEGNSRASSMNEDDFKFSGQQYGITGVMPPLGRDQTSRAKIEHYKNQWARENGYTPRDLVTMQAAFQGDKDSLKKFQAQRDQIVSFESAATKNLDMAVELGKKLSDSGSPLLNTPLRSIDRSALGSNEQAAFDAALQVANNEVAKVTSGGGLGGVLSDSARQEIEKLNPRNATLGNMIAIAGVLKRDMANRHGSMDATLQEIKNRMGGGSKPAAGKEVWDFDASGNLVKK